MSRRSMKRRQRKARRALFHLLRIEQALAPKSHGSGLMDLAAVASSVGADFRAAWDKMIEQNNEEIRRSLLLGESHLASF
jgi:hypothetical protein